MYPHVDPRTKSPLTAVPTRIAGRCGPSGGAARPPLFIQHLFLHPAAAPRPAFCRSVILLQFAHTRAKRRLLGVVGVWGCPVPGNGTRGHTGVNWGYSSSAFSLFTVPQFLSRLLFVDGGAFSELRETTFLFSAFVVYWNYQEGR